MDQSMINEFKEKFLKIQESILRADGQNELARPTEGDELEICARDQGLQLSLKLKGRDVFYLKKINEALNRIEEGNFGMCCECGDDIGLSRLHARPTAELCIRCKEEQEKEENFIAYDKKSRTNGKGFNNTHPSNITPIKEGEDNLINWSTIA